MRTIELMCFVALSFAGMGGSFSDCDSRHGAKTTMEKQNSNVPTETKQNRTAEFKEISAGKGTTRDGAPFSTQLFESQEGVRVSIIRENRDSPVRADKELQRRIKQALEIVERGPKVDERGQRVGERIVAKFAKNGSAEEEVAILWTEGQQLYSIKSLSLTVALEFEKKFYR